jgi:hypothetical protein
MINIIKGKMGPRGPARASTTESHTANTTTSDPTHTEVAPMTHPHPSCSCLIVCHRWAHADAPLHSATKPCQYMLSPIARASGIAHIPDFQSKLGNNLGNSDRVSWSAAPTLLYNSPRGRLRSGRSVGPARPLQRPLGDPDRGVDRSGKGPGSRPGRIGRSGGWR